VKNLINEKYKNDLFEFRKEGAFNNSREAYKIVARFLKRFRPKTVLDFGCGSGDLCKIVSEKHPNIEIRGYDPGNPAFCIFPDEKFDAVISTDVLEHIEPEYLDQTLCELSRSANNYAFFRIACYPARKTLPDGRNAHLIVEPPDWWREKILSVMKFKILQEKISVVDKTSRWDEVKGFNYDVILKNPECQEARFFAEIITKYLVRKI